MDFSFDTSAFIEPWVRLYPRDIFGPHWQWIEKLIQDEVVRSTELVKTELSVTEDELFEWAKKQEHLFVPIDTDIQAALQEVITQFPQLTDHHRDRSGADPWVIALAMVEQCPVVTYEKMGKTTAPKIPNVCRHFDVKCYTWIEVLRETGFKTT